MDHLIENYRTETFSRRKKKEENRYAPFIKDMAKEVNQQPLAVRKRFFKLMTAVQVGMVPLLATPRAQASEIINFPLLEKAYGLDILPDEIVTILIQVIIACGIIGVAFAMLCLMVAGGYRIIGQTEKAGAWSVDIIKGLGQILLAPVIILVLVTLTGFMFRNVPGLEMFF